MVPKHFQNDNAKFTNKSSRVNSSNPEFNPAIEVNGKSLHYGIKKNLKKWADLVSWCRWHIDGFYDLITPDTGALIKLGLDQRVILRCLARFKNSYCVLPRGAGKCVAGDTLILTSDGVKEIGSYFNYQNDNIETISDLGIEIVNRYGNKEPTTKGIYSGRKPTIKLTTNEGYSIEGTYAHPLLTMNKNGDLEYKQLQDIQKDDYVCVRRGDNVWGNNLDIDVSSQLQQWLNSRLPRYNQKIKVRNLPKVITEDIAYFIGILLGDGCLTRPNSVSFSNIDKDVLDRFYRICQDVFQVNYIRKKDYKDYYIYDMYFRKYLEFIGLGYEDSHGKAIPERFMCAPKNIIKKVLQGLFDTDGCGEKRAISYCTVSEKLAKQIQILLLNFGVVCSCKKYYDRQGRHSFNIYITCENVDIFNREIGFLCNKKRERAEKLAQKKHNTNIDIIPYQFKYCNEVYNATKKGVSHHFFYHCGKYCDNNMTYYRLQQLMSADYKDYPNKEHFEELDELNYFYSKVVNIEYGENDVYDIETSETHSFIANGLVNHNTLLSMMYAVHTCIFYPTVEVALTAQTRENAAKLIKDKYDELTRAFPLLKEEIYSAKFSKDLAEIEFHNGSKIMNLANNQSSKGAHVQRGIVDEDNLTDEETYLDVLEPIFTTVPRKTVGKYCVKDPYEMNFSISQLTSSGFRGSPAFYRCIRRLQNMVDLKGEICIGASWELQEFYGRGATKAEIMKKKEANTAVSFDMNYRAVWTGNSDSSVCSISKLLSCRTLLNCELKSSSAEDIFILSVDVARSDNENNNQTSIAILKVIKKVNGRVKEVQMPNMYAIKGTLDFEAQAIEIKRIQALYNAKMVVVDCNGIGKGIADALLREQVDPLTGKSLGCWDAVNSESLPEIPNSPKLVFCYYAQKYDNESIPNFIDYVETLKLRLLQKKDVTSYTAQLDYSKEELTPFLQTDFFIEEVANLKLKHLNNGGLSIDRVVKKMNKDRFSSVQYGLWYIAKYMDNVEEEPVDDLEELAKYIMW